MNQTIRPRNIEGFFDCGSDVCNNCEEYAGEDGGHVTVERPPVARAAPLQAAPTIAPPTRNLGNYLQCILIVTLAATIVFLLARNR